MLYNKEKSQLKQIKTQETVKNKRCEAAAAVGMKISPLHVKHSFLLHSNTFSFSLNKGMFCEIIKGFYSVGFCQRVASHNPLPLARNICMEPSSHCAVYTPLKWKVKVWEPNKASKVGAREQASGWTRDRSGVPGSCVLLSASVCFCIFQLRGGRALVSDDRNPLVQTLSTLQRYASRCSHFRSHSDACSAWTRRCGI